MLKRFRKEHIILLTLIAGIFILGLLTGCASTGESLRFKEPVRSMMYSSALRGRVPVTVIQCWEAELLKQGIKSPSQVSEAAFKKAQKICEKDLVPEVKKEIEEALAAEEEAASI